MIGALSPGFWVSKSKRNTLFLPNQWFAQFGKTVLGHEEQTWFHIDKEMVWKYVWGTKTWLFRAVLNQISSICALVSGADVQNFQALFKHQILLPTAMRVSFFNVTRRDNSWTNFQNSTIFVLFPGYNCYTVSYSFIHSLHERSTADQFGCIRGFLLNPRSNSFCWKHLHTILQVCHLQKRTAVHKHYCSSPWDLKSHDKSAMCKWFAGYQEFPIKWKK